MRTEFFLSISLSLMGWGVWAGSLALGQDLDRAVVEGRVIDAHGDVVVGVKVTVREESTGYEREAVTDRTGGYRFSALSPGNYTLRATAEGFAPVEYAHVVLRAGQTVRRDFRLGPAGFVERVTVSQRDESSLIDVRRTVLGTTFTSDEIDDLPLDGRDPLDLVFLLANVQAAPFEIRHLGDPGTWDEVLLPSEEAGLFSLAGGRATANHITVNGLDNNDDRTAREQSSPSIEEIEAVQVITNQYSAKYGRASGGRVNIRTRRGRNQWHGRAFFQIQDEVFNANSFFRNARRQPRLPFQRRHIGGRVGGPIRRDRLFWFAAIERRDEQDLDAIIALLPADPQLNPHYPLNETPTGKLRERDGIQVGLLEEDFLTPSVRTTFAGRLDAQRHSGQQWAFRFSGTVTDSLRARSRGATVRSGLLNRRRDAWSIQVHHDWTIDAARVNQFRFQYSQFTPQLIPRDRRPGVVVGSSRGTRPFILGTGFVAGASGFPETRAARRWQWTDTLSWEHHAHEWKLGADIIVLRSTTSRLNRFFGFYNFSGFDDFAQSRPSRFRQRIGDPDQLIKNTIVGAFFEDAWRVRRHLTLTFGLRYDRESLLGGDDNNFGPRLALAWDPLASGKMVVRAGVGIFYNRVLLRTIEDFAVESRLFEIDLSSRADATGPLTALDRIGGFPHIFPNDPTDPLVRDLIRPILDTRRLSPDLRIPYSLQASLGIEREIFDGWKLEVDYTVHRGVKLWRDHNINAPVPPPGGFVAFLLDPPLDYPGVIVLEDGTKVFDNRERQIADVGIPFVRFDLSDERRKDVGRGRQKTRVYGLNAVGGGASTTDPVEAALNAVQYLRPNPRLGEIEQLQSDAQSIYHGLTIGVQKYFGRRLVLRASYTLSKLLDNTTVNTSSPLDEFNLSLERSLGRTDERHRFVFSGRFTLPPFLGALHISSILRLSSGRPFNISTNGQDRNLSDVPNDRPHFRGRGPIRFVHPGDASTSAAWARLFVFSTVGTNGTLGRNAGRGPGIHRLDMRISRTFRVRERVTVRPWIDIDNVTNTTNFLMNGFIGPLDTRFRESVFLQPRASRKPRTMDLGVRIEF
ncbi:MAG: TonB-dependent receptor [Acidobacteria bacterium]|nr:MAG: TonB-dependent receptor [Acidobacteriota bacterium]